MDEKSTKSPSQIYYEKNKDAARSYYQLNKDKLKIRSNSYYQKNKDKLKNYYILNKDKIKKYTKIYSPQYYQKNKEKIKAYQKKNREKIKKYQSLHQPNYRTKRKNYDPNFKIACNLRTRIHTAINKKYKSGSAVRDLGCSIPEFKKFISEKFQLGMSWENYGKWHLDHIKPLSLFDLTNREEFLKACYFTNYQPLWASDNIIKGSNFP